jgi:hypothetical protein
MCTFALAGAHNKAHTHWLYWKCMKCPGQDSFNGWIHQRPLPPDTKSPFLGISAPPYTHFSLSPPLKPFPYLSLTSPGTTPTPTTTKTPSKNPNALLISPTLIRKIAQVVKALEHINNKDNKTSDNEKDKDEKAATTPRTTRSTTPLPPSRTRTTKPKSLRPPPATKKERKTMNKTCYHVNPHLNIDNKIN